MFKPTEAKVLTNANEKIVNLAPAEVIFSDVKIQLQSTFIFKEGSDNVEIHRQIISSTKEEAVFLIEEYMTATYGYTKYAENMNGIMLQGVSTDEKRTIPYAYKSRSETISRGIITKANIPQIQTSVSLCCKDSISATIQEGYAFSPMFTVTSSPA